MKGDRVLATLMVILIGTPVLFVAYAILARHVVHGEVTHESLATSVAREAPYGGDGSCRRHGEEWRCGVADSSQTREYRVRIVDSSCWTARRIGALRREGSFGGCVHRWEWSLDSLL